MILIGRSFRGWVLNIPTGNPLPFWDDYMRINRYSAPKSAPWNSSSNLKCLHMFLIDISFRSNNLWVFEFEHDTPFPPKKMRSLLFAPNSKSWWSSPVAVGTWFMNMLIKMIKGVLYFPAFPIPSMGLGCLPTFPIKIKCIGKFTIHGFYGFWQDPKLTIANFSSSADRYQPNFRSQKSQKVWGP